MSFFNGCCCKGAAIEEVVSITAHTTSERGAVHIKPRPPVELGSGDVTDSRDLMVGDMKVGSDDTDKMKEDELENARDVFESKEEARLLEDDPKPAVVEEDTALVKNTLTCESDMPAVAAAVPSEVCPSEETYTVEVERTENNPVGLECVVTKSDELCVMSIELGPFLDWNMMHAKSTQIWEGDRIVEVNNIKQNSQAMLSSISVDCILSITFRRRSEFEVKISKNGEPLAIDINCKMSREGLQVNKVHEGLISAWNEANPTRQILEKDRIVEVNGLRGEPKILLETVKASSDLTLKMISFN
jgi:hypothetical protein